MKINLNVTKNVNKGKQLYTGVYFHVITIYSLWNHAMPEMNIVWITGCFKINYHQIRGLIGNSMVLNDITFGKKTHENIGTR